MIVVTGASGLLGSHLLLELVREGKPVRALKRKDTYLKQVEYVFSRYNVSHLLAKIEWVNGDVTDIHSLAGAFKGAKQVYHCAGMVSFHAKDEVLLNKINVEGTSNVMNACFDEGVEKVCHVSSVAALNNAIAGQEITENTFWKSSPNNSAYSISKYGAEREAWRAMEEGLNVVIVNPSVIIGHSILTGGSSAMLLRAKKGNPFYTHGQTGFVDALDVARVMIKLMEGPYNKERFIISSENLTYKDFYTIANKAFGNKPPTIYCGKVITEIGWRILRLLQIFTGFTPRITKDIARAVHNKKSFSNNKVKTALAYSFKRINESILELSKEVLPR